MKCTNYRILVGGQVQCTCCSHYCIVNKNTPGKCNVRKIINDQFTLIVGNKPSAVNIDPIEKKPLYHFKPGMQILSLGTIGCNFTCDFCQNWSISQERDLEDTIQELTPEQVIEICLRKKIPAIAFTYNEPTVWFEYNFAIATLAKQNNIFTVYVTNGFMSRETRELLLPVIDAFNIDLKSFSNATYQKFMSGKLEIVKKNIEFFFSHSKIVEITTLLIPTMNDSLEEINELTKWISTVSRDIPWHVSAFHPDYKMTATKRTPQDLIEKACAIGAENGLRYVYAGNCKIEKFQNTICECGEKLVDRTNYAGRKTDGFAGKCNKCEKKIYGIWE